MTLHVLAHLDLGDAFVLNGLIRTLARPNQNVVWYVRECYVTEVARMMSDLDRLIVKPALGGYDDIEASWLKEENVLRLGLFAGPRFDWSHWDWEMYRQAGVPFENRWSRFYHAIWKNSYRFQPEPGRIFVHERPDTGAVIAPQHLPESPYVIRVNRVEYRLAEQWIREEAFRASEIHVVDSAFLCALDSLKWPEKGVHFFFHAYAKKYNRGVWPVGWPALRNPWRIVT